MCLKEHIIWVDENARLNNVHSIGGIQQKILLFKDSNARAHLSFIVIIKNHLYIILIQIYHRMQQPNKKSLYLKTVKQK